MLEIKQVIGGRRNVTLHITGMLTEGDLTVTSFDLSSGQPNRLDSTRRAKLASLAWVVQEKLVIYLRWEPHGIPFALESRNGIKLDPAMAAPEQWDGLMYIESRNWSGPEKALFIILDFDL
jgi:hypothetical protein